MKRIYQETAWDGTMDFILDYLPEQEAREAAKDPERRISTSLVPDGWGLPGFTGWTEADVAASEAAGRQRLLSDGSVREWGDEDKYGED